MPVGDIQLQHDRAAVDIDRLKRDIQWGVDHNARYIGMADFIDMESPSNRTALERSGVYDSVIDALDAKAEDLEEVLKEILKLTIGRRLGVLEGTTTTFTRTAPRPTSASPSSSSAPSSERPRT